MCGLGLSCEQLPEPISEGEPPCVCAGLVPTERLLHEGELAAGVVPAAAGGKSVYVGPELPTCASASSRMWRNQPVLFCWLAVE